MKNRFEYITDFKDLFDEAVYALAMCETKEEETLILKELQEHSISISDKSSICE